MKTRHFVVLAAVCLASVGCRVDPRIAMLERQNRLLEDEIYRLRWELEDCQGKGTACRASGGDQSARLESGVGGGPVFPDTPSPSRPSGAAASKGPGPLTVELGEELPQGQQPKIFKSPPPQVPPPTGPVLPEQPEPKSLPTPVQPPRNKDAEEPVPRVKPAPESKPSPPAEPAPQTQPTPEASAARQLPPPAESRDVVQLALSRTGCGGYDADGKPGDDGLRVLLEPRDADGRLVAAPAEVAIVLLDPAIDGEAARVGRWDFTSDEIARRLGKGNSDRGIELKTPWPSRPPQHNELHLFVRYTTQDGRRMESDTPVRIALAGEPSRRWSPTEPARTPGPPSGPATGSGPALRAEQPAEGHRSPPHVRLQQTPTPAKSPPAAPSAALPVWSPNRQR